MNRLVEIKNVIICICILYGTLTISSMTIYIGPSCGQKVRKGGEVQIKPNLTHQLFTFTFISVAQRVAPDGALIIPGHSKKKECWGWGFGAGS